MGFTHHVAARFLRSRRSRFVSLITVIAVLGITVGVMVLNVTLAVMNGFRDQIQLTFVENMPMVTVHTTRPSGFEDLEGLVERIRQMPEVVAAAPFLRKEAVLTLERVPGRPRHRAGVVWGVDPLRQDAVTPLAQHIDPPLLDFSTEGMVGGGPEVPGLVMGAQMAAGLRAGVGDVVTVTTPRATGSALQEFTGITREFLVVGVLTTGMFEFDSTFCYIDLAVAQDFFDQPGGADGIGLRVTEMMEADRIAGRIEDELGFPPYAASDWISLNSQLFEWIRMEKALMFLLLSLITLVASFAVVAILTMMVRDRQRDIGVLMSLGVSKRRLVGIFVELGMWIGSSGMLLGTLLGLLLCWLLDTIGFPLPGDVYFVDTLPVHARLTDFLLVGGVTLSMAFLATLLPSWLASRFTPVEVLRYE